MKLKLALSILLLFVFSLGYSQEEEINVAGLVFLKYNDNMPENIRSAKTVVLVGTPAKPGSSIREDWKGMVETAHKEFAAVGVDAIGYYFYEDVIAGKESKIAFAQAWKKREVENIIILSKVNVKVKNKASSRYVILGTAFNGESSLMSDGQDAWKTQSKDLGKALDKFVKTTNKLKKGNLLVLDKPEYFNDASMVRGKRVESYYTDLATGKLAIPKFSLATAPSKIPSGIVNKQVEKQLVKANDQAKANNVALKRIVEANYPMSFELTDPSESEKELLDKGFSFVLYRLHTSGKSIQRLLNYDVDDEDETYVTLIEKNGKPTLRYIPVDAPVYKYYIKHIKSGNVYLGKDWDADETWQNAMQHWIKGVRKELKK